MKIFTATQLYILLKMSIQDVQNRRSAAVSKMPILRGALPASDMDKGYERRKEESRPVDANRLFNILTSNNDIIVGDLPDSIPYAMPNNIKICQ